MTTQVVKKKQKKCQSNYYFWWLFFASNRYNFVSPPPMALPGVMFTLKEIKAAPKNPTVDEIYEFIKTLFNKACLSSECSLVRTRLVVVVAREQLF